MLSEVEVVIDWHTALNAGDMDGMIGLVHEDVEVGGPRGKTRGVDAMREWFGRAGVTLKPLQFYYGGETVVVDEDAEWHSAGGQVTDAQPVTTVFVVIDRRIASILRYEDTATALAEAGLTEVDMIER